MNWCGRLGADDMDNLIIANKEFTSRLMLGTGKFASTHLLRDAITVAATQIVTVALRRVNSAEAQDDILEAIDREQIQLLPNTSGARNAREAILLAQLAREAGLGDWLKLEVIPDSKYLLPDGHETLLAATELVQDGFTVLPYIQADPVLAKQLADVGTATVMPLAAPIGSNQGLKTRQALEIIIEQAEVPVVVDAGLGVPSQACEAMELGADAVLVNTAIATAADPIAMAAAFAEAVRAGRKAYRAGRATARKESEASSPLTGFLRANE